MYILAPVTLRILLPSFVVLKQKHQKVELENCLDLFFLVSTTSPAWRSTNVLHKLVFVEEPPHYSTELG